MAYRLPTFNLFCNIWTGSTPPPNPPRLSNVPCALALGRRAGSALGYDSEAFEWGGQMWLLLPAGTDIRDDNAFTHSDIVEVGSGSGRFYEADWVDDAGGGWPNEHRFASLSKALTWPVPYPRPNAVVPPPVAGLIAVANAGPLAGTLTIPFTRPTQNLLVMVTYIENGGAPICTCYVDGTAMGTVHNFGGFTIGGDVSSQEAHTAAVGTVTTGVTINVVNGDLIWAFVYDLGTRLLLDRSVGGSFAGAGPGNVNLGALAFANEAVFASVLAQAPPSDAAWGGVAARLFTPDIAMTSSNGNAYKWSAVWVDPYGPAAPTITYTYSGGAPAFLERAGSSWR